jgi:drug/metabolite transporter (DMT)-like permease
MTESQRKTYATIALIIAGIFGGLVPIAVKIVLKEVPPLTYLFLRLTIMICILLPLSLKVIKSLHQYWKYICLLGIFWIANFMLFIFGVRFTTALMSQLLTSGVPIFVLIENSFVNKEKLSPWQYLGIFLGLTGAIFLILRNTSLSSGYGLISGNLLVFLSAISSSLYLIGTRKFIRNQSPLALTSATVFIGWIITGISMLLLEGISGFSVLPHITTNAWTALLFMGLICGVLMWFLINWGLKYASAIVASGMTYINILTAGIFGVIILGESVNQNTIFGGIFIIIGIFLSSITPLLLKGQK